MVICGIHKTREQKMSEQIKKYIKKGDTVYTICRQVSASGMYRHISLLIKTDENILNLSYSIAEILGMRYKDKTNSIGVSGCGMDMGFHVVYELSHHLFGDGYAIKQRWI
jgi:hypothetical protein